MAVIATTTSDQFPAVLAEQPFAGAGLCARRHQPARQRGAGIHPEFISGMAKRNDRFIILLDVNRVLSVDEMAELSRAASDNRGTPLLEHDGE